VYKQDREAAERHHEQITGRLEPVLAIYVDGSGIHKKVGAAAAAALMPTLRHIWEKKQLQQSTQLNYWEVMIGIEIATRSN
jgi:hypothetical protein